MLALKDNELLSFIVNAFLLVLEVCTAETIELRGSDEN